MIGLKRRHAVHEQLQRVLSRYGAERAPGHGSQDGNAQTDMGPHVSE
jgi:hypothetical protein